MTENSTPDILSGKALYLFPNCGVQMENPLHFSPHIIL